MLVKTNVWNRGNDYYSGDHNGKKGSQNTRKGYCVEIPVDFDVVIVA